MTSHPSSILTHTHGTLPCVPASLASQGFYKHEDMRGFQWEGHSTDSWPHTKRSWVLHCGMQHSPLTAHQVTHVDKEEPNKLFRGGAGIWTPRVFWHQTESLLTFTQRGMKAMEEVMSSEYSWCRESLKSSPMTDRDGWPNLCLFFSEDLYCGSDKDRWAVMRADLVCVSCHPSTGHHLTSLSWGVKTKPRVNSFCFGSFPLNFFK